MIIIQNPWESETVVENGSYMLRRTNPKTRKKLLDEYKEKREKELYKLKTLI